jgi:hypothetical protein
MKKISMIIGSTLMFAVTAFAAARYVSVSGAGVDTETDQPTAHQNADSQAQTNLQNACPGTLSSPRKIYDQCSQVGDNYVCSVNYTGICQVGN